MAAVDESASMGGLVVAVMALHVLGGVDHPPALALFDGEARSQVAGTGD
jgi:hypothetical protein